MKTILVLGASSDMGMGYIENLETTHKAGEVQVIAHYRTMSEKLNELIVSAKNVSIEAAQADLQAPKDIERLIDVISAKYAAPTHIIHLAAGRFRHMRIRQFDSEAIRAEMQVQVYSLGEILKAFLPAMAKKRYGKVVIMLTAYTAGIPPKFVADYAICKYALLGLMKAAAAEYSEKGVCINAVSPSMVETKFLDDIDSRIVELAATGNPMKRNASIAEVVSAINFLMADENSYMCGVNLNVSGGLLV
jgi:3-oxoacyl-[acyl-carrier protein] reductase